MSPPPLTIRREEPCDIVSIRAVTQEAFAGQAFSQGTEAAIIDSLRESNSLLLSLVAVIDGEVVGHVAFSPITIEGRDLGWVGLGPVSVKPSFQGRCIGKTIISNGLQIVFASGSKGCVLLGSREYYCRFGFANNDRLVFAGAPAEHFMILSANTFVPQGRVSYHEAFSLI